MMAMPFEAQFIEHHPRYEVLANWACAAALAASGLIKPGAYHPPQKENMR